MTSLSDAYARLCQWFDWQSGAIPLSGPEAPALGVSFYLVGIFGLRAALGGSVCRVPPLLAALHNFILCSGSAVMLAGCAYEAMQVRVMTLLIISMLLRAMAYYAGLTIASGFV